MERYLLTKQQYEKFVQRVSTKYTITQRSVTNKDGDLKSLYIRNNGGILSSGYLLKFERFENAYTVKFSNLHYLRILLIIGAIVVLGITIVIPLILGILLVYTYMRDQNFKKELEKEIEAVK